jgi:hypothetical protein
MTSGWAAKAVHTAMQAAIEGSSIAASVTGVYSFVPDTTAFPYLVINDIFSEDWDTKTELGCVCYVNIHVYTAYSGVKQAYDIMDSLLSLFHRANLTITGHRSILCQWDKLADGRPEFSDNNKIYHGVVRFKIITQKA